MSKVKIYKLTEVDEIVKHEKLLPKLLFDLPRDENQYTFEISRLSGWLYYMNHEEFMKNVKIQFLPKDSWEVRGAFKGFMKNVEKRMSNELKINPKFSLRNIFPTIFGEPVISAVLNPETELIDHWLVRVLPSLTGIRGGDKKLPVLGSSFDVRIGNGGQVIGLSSNWRPIEKVLQTDLIEAAMSLNQELELHSHDHKGYNTTENIDAVLNSDPHTDLCYLDKGESVVQNYLTPLYVYVSDHHYNFYPASEHSMFIEIVEDHLRDGVKLYAIVKGGSRNYSFEWATWKIEELDSSFQYCGNLDQIKLPLGTYTVALSVYDNVTGIIDQTRILIYALGIDFQEGGVNLS